MKKIISISLLFFVFQGYISAQQSIYQTRNATLQVYGEFDGEKLEGNTTTLGISLDYETTEINIRFQMNTLKVNSDSLNYLLQSNFSEVIFEGKINLDNINTKNHPPQKFTFEGWVKNGNLKNKLDGTGELIHINNAEIFSCLMEMTLKLNLEDFNIKIPNLQNEVEVVIAQALLTTDKD